MKTVTYQNVQDQAGELAGRPVGKLPVSEQNILLMLFATELKVMWNSQCWPELCELIAFPVVNTNGNVKISKNEGTTTEIGEVLTVLTSDPRNTQGPRAHSIEFKIGNNEIDLLRPLATQYSSLWVDYIIPPQDLLAINANPVTYPYQSDIGNSANPPTLAGTLIPARFYLPLAAMGASKLLTIDGLLAQAAAMKAMAQENLDWQTVQADMRQPWWRGIRIKR